MLLSFSIYSSSSSLIIKAIFAVACLSVLVLDDIICLADSTVIESTTASDVVIPPGLPALTLEAILDSASNAISETWAFTALGLDDIISLAASISASSSMVKDTRFLADLGFDDLVDFVDLDEGPYNVE